MLEIGIPQFSFTFERSTMSDAHKIATSYLEAVQQGDFVAARKLLDDKLSFKGPLETLHSPDALIASLKKLHPIVERIDIKKIFTDGNEVCVLCDLVTKSPAGTVFVVEWYQIKNDKFADVQVVFDARPFAAMFAGKAGT
jgi:limonene-1,2-epoxide hydrolase